MTSTFQDRPPLASVASLEDAQVAVARLLEVTRSAHVRSSQLQHALDSRIVIEQAKGVLAERYGLSVDQAFELMRRAARTNRLKVHRLAEAVVCSSETPAEIASVHEAG
jgi:AmiR/NasT family two-component response regulator